MLFLKFMNLFVMQIHLKNKDFKRADEIRDSLKEMNIELKDTRNGVIWKRV